MSYKNTLVDDSVSQGTRLNINQKYSNDCKELFE